MVTVTLHVDVPLCAEKMEKEESLVLVGMGRHQVISDEKKKALQW
jgi:hypothetical protein